MLVLGRFSEFSSMSRGVREPESAGDSQLGESEQAEDGVRGEFGVVDEEEEEHV